MTLSEAILHYSQLSSDSKSKELEHWILQESTGEVMFTSDELEKFKQDAEDNMQLAEWLRELEVYRDVYKKVKEEISEHRESLKMMALCDDWYSGKLRGYDCAIEIIDKFLKEVVK